MSKASKIELYDHRNIDSLAWPENEIGRQAKQLLLPLIRDGVESYVSNVKTQMILLKVGDVVLPATINEADYQNSYVVSNYYIVAALESWFAKASPFLQAFKKPSTWILARFLKRIKINCIVLVNNWLFATNLYPELTFEHVSAISSFLKEHYPKHVHFFRGINHLKGHGLYEALEKMHYHLIQSRKVYVYDPKNKQSLSSKVHYHHRRDLRLIETNGYTIIRKNDLLSNDLPRILELYRQVYLERHTFYSPDYTLGFLKALLNTEDIDFIGLKKEGKIDGIMAVRALNGVMTVPFFGYDTKIPQSVGLYRIMSVLAIKESEKRNVILNDSSGASAPKTFRGLKPYQEYVAVYDKHLPMKRRFFWGSVKIICKHFQQ